MPSLDHDIEVVSQDIRRDNITGLTYYLQMFGPPICEDLKGLWNEELDVYILDDRLPNPEFCEACWVTREYSTTWRDYDLYSRYKCHHPDEHLYLGDYFYMLPIPDYYDYDDYDAWANAVLQYGLYYAEQAGFRPWCTGVGNCYWKPTSSFEFGSSSIVPGTWKGNFVPGAPPDAWFDTTQLVKLQMPMTIWTAYQQDNLSYGYMWHTKKLTFWSTRVDAVWKYCTELKLSAFDPTLPDLQEGEEIYNTYDEVISSESGYSESGFSTIVSHLHARTYEIRRLKLKSEF